MDRIRLINAINNCDLDSEKLYENINFINKEKTNFNTESYDEIVYLTMYIYHIKNGINTLSKKGNIPELIPRKISYLNFKNQLEKYNSINYHNPLLPYINNAYQELKRLSSDILLDRGYWTKIYSTSISKSEFKEDGKIYISIDNSHLYQFACLMLVDCLKNNLNDYEFKANNYQEVNRTDNFVIYFTADNLNTYLKIIEKIKKQYPEFKINCSHILGKKISEGVVIAKDYKDGSSFTDKICNAIIALKEKGYDTENVVDLIDSFVDKHLESVMPLISKNKYKK